MILPLTIMIEVPIEFNHLCHDLHLSSMLEKIAQRETQQYVDNIIEMHKLYDPTKIGA